MSLNHDITLHEFITAFDLRQPNGIVYFNARIDFILNDLVETKDSKVHVVTIKDILFIYLLNPAIDSLQLPDLFSTENNAFTYSAKQYLEIGGMKNNSSYTVRIFPEV